MSDTVIVLQEECIWLQVEKQDEDQNQQDRHDPDRSSHRPF